MSNMKNGLSTLNRWLGKKNKAEKDIPNGKLSKSTTNLSVYSSTSNINETTQMEYNRITPLPVVTSNAPFEQTFRITVLLPKDQLYVARLGARVPLSKLMELVSENKQLDSDKYEFRNPVDPSQVYSCDLTIGSVGLSEIRLCHKSDPCNTIYSSEDVLKMKRTAGLRDSLSSSEISSRNLKLNTKTPSPYSSCNSLNSMDSTGNHYVRTPVTPAAMSASKLMAPPRKKRAAPRPPSQMVIPEKADLIIENGSKAEEKGQEVPLKIAPISRKDHFVSTPNLATKATTPDEHIDCNGNTKLNGNAGLANGHSYEEQQKVEENNARNLYSPTSVQDLSQLSPDSLQRFPEASPRKRMVQVKKKTAAPAAPPRGSMYFEDGLSIASMSLSSHGEELANGNTQPCTPEPIEPSSVEAVPKPASRDSVHSSVNGASMTTITYHEEEQTAKTTTIPAIAPMTPTPIPRQTTATVAISPTPQKANVSKVLLNRTPTPEPRSLSCEPPDLDGDSLSHLNSSTLGGGACDADDDTISKQADSGIGEPVPSPTPDSLPSVGSGHEFKSTFESTSSDDDDMVKVYNFKLGKTVVQPLDETHKSLAELRELTADQTDSGGVSPTSTLTQTSATPLSETASWNFSIPISPPPNFADSAKAKEGLAAANNKTQPDDTPITPKIKERPVLNFESIASEQAPTSLPVAEDRSAKEATPLSSPTSPLNELVDELSAILQGNRVDSLIKKSDDQPQIESAKPNSLSNFSITTITQHPVKAPAIAQEKPTATATPPSTPAASPDTMPNEEQLYRKRASITSNGSGGGLRKHRTSVSRADSFHTTTLQGERSSGLNSRSSSHMSLTKLEHSDRMNRRRSSSELSIGESPSLQSLEVIKTILSNSRKNSLASGSDAESKASVAEVISRLEQEQPKKQDRAESSQATPETKVVTRETREIKLETKEVKPEPSQIKPEPTQIKPEPTQVIPEPTQVKPEPTPVKPEPPAVKPEPMRDQQLEPKPSVASQGQAMEAEQPTPKETPKVYRYSGPPSINLGTWAERPKANVAIKNEGDYIFGGKNAGSGAVTQATMEINSNSIPRNYRASLPAVAPKPVTTTIKRMGIPEEEGKEYKVPITVKPIKDVVVESVPPVEKPKPAVAEKPPVAIKSTTTVTLNGGEGGDVVVKRVPQTHTSTLPRVNTAANRFSMPATSHASLTRSISITQLQQQQPQKEPEPVAAPFGQNTLRKTGLKEKILADEKKAAAKEVTVKPAAKEVTVKPATTVKVLTNGSGQRTSAFVTASNGVPPPAVKPMQTARLELKLQKTSSVFLNQQPQHPAEPKTAPVQLKSIPTPPVAPKPPPMGPAFLRSVSAKPKSSTTPSPTNGDPRDQMLEAIRNFRKDALKRV